jgi:twitching motility two-component system response regulator PilG
MAGPLVLAVDDSPTIRKIVELTLRRANYRVKVAGSGLEALAALADEPPDLIVLDVMLPRMDGYQVCALIKRRTGYEHIPVLMLTGKDGIFDRVRGRMVGCSAYITKPFEPQELIAAVRQHAPLAVETSA